MSAKQFNDLADRGFCWLREGASRLRAASVLLCQAERDFMAFSQIVQRGDSPPPLAPVGFTAVMLAAMAAENAIKGVIVEKQGPAAKEELKFGVARDPSHDLWKLAEYAGIKPEDKYEEDALRHGRQFLTWLGRYPSPMAAKSYPLGWAVSPPLLLQAYRRIFLRAAEATARAQHAHRPDLQHQSADEYAAATRKIVSDWLGEPL
jgi:hypothetical protein